MFKLLLKVNLFFLISILVSCGGGSSGTGGFSIKGTVKTPSNLPLTDVEVKILDINRNIIATTSSNSSGIYEFGTFALKEFLVSVDGEEFLVQIPDEITLVSIDIIVSEEFVDFEIVYDEFVTDDSDPGDDIIIEPNG